ncbi:Flp pilus assembly protein CpaB [Limnohabitans sp. Jir72]|uniref:Flp pilus assembly protein CpaB n=1 Tax=Limnohabitans sp. Jir72 TaxID=1977909 RepID=UPI000D3C9ECF|nr:Flp pilus assembly protein CpaB [Limnohabitans sp. Jir72]PUE33336.1 Flp pilus assembly protein CpaB [Limnohabitans sp. Jir72]
MRNIRVAVMLLLALGMGIAAVVMAAYWLNSKSSVMTSHVVVSKEDLQLGTRLQPNMVEVVDWPSTSPIKNPMTSVQQASDRVVNVPVFRGEPILMSKLAAVGETGGLSAVLHEGRRAVTVKVNEIVGVAGFALPGTFVDVMVNTVDVHNSAVSKIVIERIKVLAVAQDVSNLETKPKVVNAVTLEVTPAQAEKIDLARSVGSLSLVLRSQVDMQSVSTLGARKDDLLEGSESPSSSLTGVLSSAMSNIKTQVAKLSAQPVRTPSNASKSNVPMTDKTEVIRGLNKTTE